jgi:lactate permease
LYGSATGVWNVDWITFWGLMLFNTLGVSGVFENFRRWLISQGTLDIRVQTMLFAWAFGALLEGLVGFGYPWAVVAPILISLGLTDLDAIRVAAIANNAPVSYGALGAPIIALAAVTGYPLLALSGAVGTVVAILALLPPWVLIYVVAGKEGFKDGWPLAVVGSVGYVLGQWPTAYYFGPYLPDVIGSIVCFCGLLLLLRVWQPSRILGHGGQPVEASVVAAQAAEHGLTGGEVMLAWMPFAVLVVVVALWTGPWSSLPAVGWYSVQVQALAPETKATITAAFKFAPWIGGSAILASWLIVVASLLFATMGVCVKLATAHYGSGEIVMYRGLVGVIGIAMHREMRAARIALFILLPMYTLIAGLNVVQLLQHMDETGTISYSPGRMRCVGVITLEVHSEIQKMFA